MYLQKVWVIILPKLKLENFKLSLPSFDIPVFFGHFYKIKIMRVQVLVHLWTHLCMEAIQQVTEAGYCGSISVDPN